jgi:hypothetical protein
MLPNDHKILSHQDIVTGFLLGKSSHQNRARKGSPIWPPARSTLLSQRQPPAGRHVEQRFRQRWRHLDISSVEIHGRTWCTEAIDLRQVVGAHPTLSASTIRGHRPVRL